jgi:uncharacterized protein YndB with AHSA1/START domain
MERKTQVRAGSGQQDIIITREFDLPVELLFKAYEDPEIVAQWMGTKVIKLETRQHGGFQFETSDATGNVVFRANGVIHSFVADRNITRTFEMENATFGAQLEFLDFEALTDDTSKLTIQSIYRSSAARDEQLKLPFAFGLNMAHNRLQEIARTLK